VAVVDTLPEPAAFPFVAALKTPERYPWLCRLILAAWCGILFFYGLNAGQLWKTESLRAIIAADYLRTGNWIVPMLYGEPLFTKPPGMYAAIALCSWPVAAVHEWTARLPSALAATLTVLMLYGYFARCFGRLGGLVVAAVVPMSPMWLDKATAAEIDMMHVMWVTGAILCLLRVLEIADSVGPAVINHAARSATSGVVYPRRLFRWWLAALLCVAGGVLTKWTSPAFFYATALPLLWWRGRLRLLISCQHLAAAAIGASLCLAWVAAAVAVEGSDVFFNTVKREALQRMVPDYAPHPDPWYIAVLHPIRLWYTNLPWSLVALVACWPGFGCLWDRRGQLLWQALHCWIWPNILIWSLMVDHKPRHSFPLFPAIGGLAAMVWIAGLTGRLTWPARFEPRRLLAGAMVVWLILKVVWVQAVIPHRDLQRDPRGKGALLASLVPGHCILYLFQMKDEGIMFYYGRSVQRLPGPADLPSSGEPLYCILGQDEFERWARHSNRALVPLTQGMTDEQGAPMVLVRVLPGS
jgi:4-amino-4-deoxy-L-arabinose transferase-like glycosyltransferase